MVFIEFIIKHFGKYQVVIEWEAMLLLAVEDIFEARNRRQVVSYEAEGLARLSDDCGLWHLAVCKRRTIKNEMCENRLSVTKLSRVTVCSAS